MPMALAAMGVLEKLPETVLAEQSPPLVPVKFSVVGTALSVPSLFSTDNGNLNWAVITPFELLRKRVS